MVRWYVSIARARGWRNAPIAASLTGGDIRLVPARLPARPDKWYLGSGDGLLWAPPFPQWLESPGFWDEAHLYQYAVRPLFTVSLVADGAPLPVRCTRRSWRPGTLTLAYAAGPLRATETRAVTGGALVSEWALVNRGRQPVAVDVVVWTAVDGEAVHGDVRPVDGALTWRLAVRDRQGHNAVVEHRLALTPAAHSVAAVRAEASSPVLPPRFELTPFCDGWRRSGRLDGRLALAGIAARGLVFVALQRRVRVPPRAVTRCSASLGLALEAAERPSRSVPVRFRPPRVADARVAWERFFASVPAFRCSDPYLERHWWHRWYGLRLNGLAPGAPNYRYPTVCEGIAYFHVPIAYSAPCHLRELRWYGDPEWARGVLRTFLAHQQADGSFHGRIYADHLVGTDFYHADWGGALLALDAVHPDAAFRAEVYPGLARYAAWLVASRAGDGSGMIDVRNHYETGQEYMSRYQAVDPASDRRGWQGGAPLKGVDVTVYAYRLFRALAHLATEVRPDERDAWRRLAEATGRAIHARMWDAGAGMFSDVDPATGTRTGVKAAVCFYPYLTDLVDGAQVAALGRHLFDPREFWTPYPVPSSSVDDPLFDPDARWRGRRHNCPWNGRVWPMTNAHVIEALARVVRAHRPAWAPRLSRLLRRFARMMTFGGDADRPNSFEHYHPFTGRASEYRGIDDYQHSWVNDLIVSHVMGVQPHGATGVTVHPLRLGVTRAALDRVSVAGHRLTVRLAGPRFTVSVDGRRAGGGRVGEPVTVAF